MIWFTSDTHFGHAGIIRYCDRPYASVEEMDEDMISRWNDCIAPSDTVYHLGDVSFHKPARTRDILFQLNGEITLIRGNHDSGLKPDALARFKEVKDYHEITVRVGPNNKKQKIVLCHFRFAVWNHSHYGSWNLFGHSHGSSKVADDQAQLDVGVDTHDLFPYSLDEVYRLLKDRGVRVIDHHTPRGRR